MFEFNLLQMFPLCFLLLPFDYFYWFHLLVVVLFHVWFAANLETWVPLCRDTVLWRRRFSCKVRLLWELYRLPNTFYFISSNSPFSPRIISCDYFAAFSVYVWRGRSAFQAWLSSYKLSCTNIPNGSQKWHIPWHLSLIWSPNVLH